MKRGYMNWNKNLFPLSALEKRRQALMEAVAKVGVKAIVVYGDVYSADESPYYVNYTPYWHNSAVVVTEHEVYMMTGHNNHVNPWIHTLTGIEEEKLLVSGFKVPARTAQPLRERFPRDGRIGMIGTYVMASLAAALVEQGSELVVMDNIKTELLQTADEPYRETAAKTVGILRRAFEQGGEEYVQGGNPKTMAAGIEYAARKNDAMDTVLYVSYRGREFGLPVTLEDTKGRWAVHGLVQYLGVWVSLTKTFGIDTNGTDSQLEVVAVELMPGAEIPHGTDSVEVALRHVTSDTVSDLNQNVWEIVEGQALSVEVPDNESDIYCSNMYRITDRGAVVL